jgi:type II secretory pathway component PulF
MFFSAQLPLSSLTELCRSLRHNLGAGLAAQAVFRQLKASGSAPLRPVAGRVHSALEAGDKLTSALKREGPAFPPLLLALAAVGEETGQLPEIFGELERYFLLQQQLRRRFRARSLPLFVQFFLAILIITILLFILGMIGQSRGTAAFGIRGPGAALTFLASVAAILAGLVVFYLFVSRSLRRRKGFAAFLLRVPAVGPCLEALALGRFALALSLTLDSSLPVRKALRLALRATGNDAFADQADKVAATLREGTDLTTALTQTGLFPADFLAALAVAEVGGRVPEMMRHQTQHYNDEAERRLQALTRTASAALWLLYAALMIVAIFRIASAYLSALPQ